MHIDKKKEEEFYSNKDFCFSYSSLNKLLFSPYLFYKDYILQDREIKTDKHLIEGKLLHCMMFEPENFDKKFELVPEKLPSDNIRKVLKDMSHHTDVETLAECEDFIILDSLKSMNLYQTLKADEARVKKIKTQEAEIYWKFLNNQDKDVIDRNTFERVGVSITYLKNNEEVLDLLVNDTPTDFDLDPISTYKEEYLKSELVDCEFGLHGYVDFYKVDSDKKEVIICDLKTTGKTVVDFTETIDFYNYWLQAAIYMKLVYDTLGDDRDEYNIQFKFIVIDKYYQVYVFDVSDNTINDWANGLNQVINTAKFHYNSRNYSLPMNMLVNRVKL
jgi:hypothetical protein